MFLSFPKLKKAGKLGNKLGSDQDDAAARHELLDALALRAGVIVAIAFQKVDNAPYTEARADGGYEGLKDLNTAAEKCHRFYRSQLVETPTENKKAPEIVPVLRKLALFLSLLYLLFDLGITVGLFPPGSCPDGR